MGFNLLECAGPTRISTAMKLKTLPSDFKVRELSLVQPSGGKFALYRLTKSSLGTPEAMQAILKGWNLSRRQLSYGGLKDRHAETAQFLTILQGPRQDMSDRSFHLQYLGQTSRPFVAQDISANEFEIVLRGIRTEQQSSFAGRARMVQQIGVVNYFDDQRFGSLGFSGRFIAEPWCKGEYEQALFLALAEPNKHDRPRESEQKQILRDHWGKWQECKDRLDRSHRRSVVTFLVDHPTNFKRAVALIRSDLRSIYLAAFQSALWNRWISRLIEQKFGEHVAYLQSAIGALAIPHADTVQPEERTWVQQLTLPLPSARQHEWPVDSVGELDEILKDYSMERREIRLKFPRDTFFSKGIRSCWLQPSDFQFSWQTDELHPSLHALKLSFSLQRGSYATMLVKMISDQAVSLFSV